MAASACSFQDYASHASYWSGEKKKGKKTQNKTGALQLYFFPYVFGLCRHEQLPLIAQQGDVTARE